MRVNWFSPLPPSQTGIAEYSVQVLEALSRRARVIIWTDQAEWDPRLADFGEIRQFDACPDWAEMNKAEATFYNIGNNVEFHARIWEISRRHAGIVILHDTHLQHLFAALYKRVWRRPDDFCTVMRRHHGEEGQRAAEGFLRGEMTTVELSDQFPLTSLALENSLGALVHVSSEVDWVARLSRLPVTYAPLPYAADTTDGVAKAAPARPKSDGSPYRVVMFGFVGPNRRLDAILQAMQGLECRDELRLDVYGTVHDMASRQRQLQRIGLSKLVTLHGFVSDSVLDAALSSAHLAINLRYPSMGEASWTQLRQWRHALPSLVTRTGWYATLSEKAVSFVRPACEVRDIRRHLQRFLENPAAFARQGKEGLRILREEHAPDSYAAALLEIARQAERVRGRANSFRLVERTGEILGQWSAVHGEPVLVGRIVNELRRMAG